MAATLLIELLTEELPPKSLQRLSQAFCDALVDDLRGEGFLLETSAVRAFATPRRLAVQVSEVMQRSADREVVVKGPSLKAGLTAEGRPSPALQGFARKQGVNPEALERFHDGKQEIFICRSQASGVALADCLADKVQAALRKLPIPKVMRWGSGEAQFVRPVHGLIMLHGENVLPGEVMGVASARLTRGHRFMGHDDVVIEDARRYAETLAEAGCVIVDYAERRAEILRQLRAIAERENGSLNEQDPAFAPLLDEVTALVEHPSVYVGAFEEDFLAVPQECLILTMRQNQKYFPLFTSDGKLTPSFLIVSNMRVADPSFIINGNQRVVRPRLADARFFFEQDKKTGFAARAAKLDAVVYHNKLGSLGDRAQRLGQVAGAIAAQLGADKALATQAGRLCKVDLLTDMVGEFPELQGIMGRYYAQAEGLSAEVADAMAEHYRPRFAGDALPEADVASAAALADKLDALVGFFGIGQLPTGDKDPFGLRRAALGVLRILMEKPLPLDLAELIDLAADAYAPGRLHAEGFREQLLEFMLERLRVFLRDAGHAADAVDAVLAQRPTRIDRVPARLIAVRDFVALPEAQALAAANKRIGNLLKKAEGARGEVDAALLEDGAEKALFEALTKLAPQVHTHVASERYGDALRLLAGLRAPVDAFFEGVMVMAEQPSLRANRLALLDGLSQQLNAVADISRLSVEK